MLKRAIEREYEIIGEALNRITKIDPDIAISDIRKLSPLETGLSMVMILWMIPLFGV